MPKGIPRHPIVRSIDEKLGMAQQEIRRLEAARAELRRSPTERAATRARRSPATRVSLPELDASITTRHQPTGVNA